MSEKVKKKIPSQALIPITLAKNPQDIKVSMQKKDRAVTRPGAKGVGAPSKITVPVSTLIAYAKKGLSQNEIAKIMGVTAATISKHIRKAGYTMQQIQHYRDNKADIIALQGMRMLDKIHEAQDVDIHNATDMQKIATTFGILNDHERKERGLSTENILFAGIEQEEKDLIIEIKELEQEIKEKENK